MLDGVRIGLPREGLIAATPLQSVSGASSLYTVALKLVQLCKLGDCECTLTTWSALCKAITLFTTQSASLTALSNIVCKRSFELSSLCDTKFSRRWRL